MKKQIDPNLNGPQDDIIESLGINKSNNASNESSFVVKNKVDDSAVDDILQTIKEGRDVAKPAPAVSENVEHSGEHHGEHHHHHHSGEHHSEHHHHHHSGEHHGEHHHHHHSGEHHGEHHHHHHSGEHHHSASHHSKKKKKKMPVVAKVLIAIILILALIFLSVFGTFLVLEHKGKKEALPDLNKAVDYQETIEYNGHTYKYNENLFTFAFMGVDQMDIKSSDETDFVGASDANIVVAVDIKTGKTNVVAVPRDTIVDIDTWSENGTFLKTVEHQLCLAYAYGDGGALSCENQVTSISRALYNVPIDKYFMLDLSGVAPLNDAIGGVTLKSMFDLPAFGIKNGEEVTLRGEAATSYVRTRDMYALDASLNRMDRQVQYINAYANQLVPAVLNDFSVISNLYNTASKYSQTNISLSTATYLASTMLSKGVRNFDTYSIQGHMESEPDVVYENVVHARFYPDEDNLMQTVLSVFYNQID